MKYLYMTFFGFCRYTSSVSNNAPDFYIDYRTPEYFIAEIIRTFNLLVRIKIIALF